MKTNPANNIAATVGVPLSQTALHSNRANSTTQNKIIKPKDEIADTLETSDREGDGRLQYVVNTKTKKSNANDQPDSANRLDLLG
jgi:hypothetical protein